MGIANEITRLQTAKSSIKSAIENKGVTVGSDTIDTYAEKINSILTGITPNGTIDITENGTFDVTNYISAIVNVASAEKSSNIRMKTGTFTIDSDTTGYTFTGLGFTPKLVIVNSGNAGVANVARTCFWLYDEFTNQRLTLSHKSTNASLTTVVTSNYFQVQDDGFYIKQYLELPILAGTYTYLALTEEVNDEANPTGTINIVENGTYDVTNYASANVNVLNNESGIDIHDYINTAPSSNASGSYSYITKNIIKLPPIDLTGVTMMRYFFFYCELLEEVEGELDIGFSTNNTGMFGSNAASAPTALQTIKIKNLCADLDMHYCTNLTHESLLYLINNAQTVESGTLTLGNTLLAKLTSEEIEIMTNKGWTVT